MKLLKPAVNTTAYAKIGIMGFAGSGKSFTAGDLAIGLAKRHGKKQVAYFDTEKGSDFLIPRFKEQEMDLLVHRGRAFSDLISIIKEAEQGEVPTLIIDSISHVWRDLCDSYAKKMNRKRLQIQDWGVLKGQWKDFTDAYLNSKLDILMLGRAGYEYDMLENEDTGKKEMLKSGTKMKVEGETGFEPDLLIEMERVETKDRIINRAWILKDRSNTINGKSFDMPTFKNFEPFWKFVNFGGEHYGIDTKRNSTELFDDPDYSYEERRKRKEIAIEELSATLIKAGLDGTSKEAKERRVETLEKVFGSSSRTFIENMQVNDLLNKLHTLNIALGLKKEADFGDLPDAV